MDREQESGRLECPDHTPHPCRPCRTLPVLVPPSPPYPWGQMCSGLCTHTPQLQHRHQLPASTKSKSPGLLTTVMSQDEGELTRSTERGSIAAAPCPATRMVTPSRDFINPELFPGAGEGLALKGTFWGPSQESVQLQVCPPRYVGYHEEGTHQVFPNN